jgi:hypothetical protein
LAQVDDTNLDPARASIVKAVKTQAPWIGRIDVEFRDVGCSVRLYPDRLMVKARAIQQGLADESVAAALQCARFQQAVVSAIRRVNSTIEDAHRIDRHEVLEEGRA